MNSAARGSPGKLGAGAGQSPRQVRSFPDVLVILFPSDSAQWFDRSAQDGALLQAMLRPHPAYLVSMRVNNPAHDSPECIAPLP
jgi:putative SOS response-associated peptidase YedK